MEDAGFALSGHIILGPAEQGTKVPVGLRCIAAQAPSSGALKVGLGYVDQITCRNVNTYQIAEGVGQTGHRIADGYLADINTGYPDSRCAKSHVTG